jgi:hypothetical protein
MTQGAGRMVGDVSSQVSLVQAVDAEQQDVPRRVSLGMSGRHRDSERDQASSRQGCAGSCQGATST